MRLKSIKMNLVELVDSEEWPSYKSDNPERANLWKSILHDEWRENIVYILAFTDPTLWSSLCYQHR